MEKEILTVRLPSKLKEKLKNKSQEEGISINAIIINALWKLIK